MPQRLKALSLKGPKLKTAIAQKLKGAKRIAFLGVGSLLRGDDAAGMLLAEEISKSKTKRNNKIRVLFGETAPENFTGEIKKFKPTHLIIADAVDTGEKPGTIVLIEPEDAKGASFCTHSLPIKILADYLYQSTHCEIIIIGIQPKTLEFASKPTPLVKSAVKTLARLLLTINN
ncbi:MAG: hydrogenase maturation peptidase HycI [Candidatus Omnitrophica bacterium]|nr:hydrogenase maturation peptidase HycI [Candidatus Omnitrophota bacterium]